MNLNTTQIIKITCVCVYSGNTATSKRIKALKNHVVKHN